MFDMNNFYKEFCKETLDSSGLLTDFQIDCPNNFNFGYDVMDRIASQLPDKPALLWCDKEGRHRVFTYGELSTLSNQAANMLSAYGVKKGDMVLCVLKRHYQFWLVTLALCKLGAVLIPATNQLTVKDYTYRFKAAGVKHVIVTGEDESCTHVENADYDGLINKFIVNGSRDGWTPFDEEYIKYPSAMERVPTEVEESMLLYFTSGTTGYPKLALHNHYYPLAHIPTAKHWHGLHDGSLHLTVSESGWGKCMWGKMYGQFICGAQVFVYDFDRFCAADLLKKMSDFHITSFCAAPTVYRFFIKEGIEHYDLSSLEQATIAGEALNPEVYNRFLEYTGLKLREGFGQTETTLVVATQPSMEPKPGSMGKPMPLFKVEIVDEDGKNVPAGTVGEMVIRADSTNHKGLFVGYYNNQAATDSAWHDGLYHTGDTAWRDEDGYIWYVGRTDDVIKSSGYRIGPFEIESVLMEHPAVLDCAVIGAPHPIRGVVVKAVVVLTKQYAGKGDEALIKALQDHVKRTTAPYKYPRIIEFAEELPRTISGKVRRAALRGEPSDL